MIAAYYTTGNTDVLILFCVVAFIAGVVWTLWRGRGRND